MIQNALVLGNRILDELVAVRRLLTATAPQEAAPVTPALSEALQRLEVSAPLTPEQVLLVLGCSEKSLRRLMKRSEDRGVAVPRWKLGDRTWRWSGDVVGWAAGLGGGEGGS